MQNALSGEAVWSRPPGNHSYANANASERRCLNDGERDTRFTLMLQRFRLSGGMCRAHWVADLLQSRNAGDVGTLARWIVSGQVLHFEWQHETWLPLFQFDLAALTPRSGISGVLQELSDVLSNGQTAQWFSRPNSHLQGHTPAVAFATRSGAVLQAARSDRYQARAAISYKAQT